MFGKKPKEPFHEAVECLIAALETRDVYSFGHSQRVADMALELGGKVCLRGRSCTLQRIFTMSARLASRTIFCASRGSFCPTNGRLCSAIRKLVIRS